MTSLTQDIKYKFSRLNVLEKIIVLNVIVFLLGVFLRPFFSWFELPSNFLSALIQPWSIISYAFIHYDFFHILFNMLWLYVIGQMFLNLFSSKLALNVYFLGAIFGGVLYLLAYTLLPTVFPANSNLVGASAAIRALLIFLCAYTPNQEIRFFTFNIKLWYIGVAIVIFDFLGLFGFNPGGNLAHLGGALLGFLYAKQLLKGTDIGKGFEKFMDTIFSFFKSSKKGPLKTVHRRKRGAGGMQKPDFDEYNTQKKIDIILDKISKSGYDSLTEAEKEFLFRAGK